MPVMGRAVQLHFEVVCLVWQRCKQLRMGHAHRTSLSCKRQRGAGSLLPSSTGTCSTSCLLQHRLWGCCMPTEPGGNLLGSKQSSTLSDELDKNTNQHGSDQVSRVIP